MKKELSVQKNVSPNIYRSKKNFVPKNLWSKKSWDQDFGSNKILIRKNVGRKKLHMVQKNVGPQNIEPKVDKNRVSSGLDTLDMDKCCLENFTVTITIC